MQTAAPRRSRRPLWYGLLLAVATALLVFLPTSSASAATTDCSAPPSAAAPSEQSPATAIGAKPAEAPTGQDPFAPNSKTTVYREYGWPTNWWSTYTLGCGTDVNRDPTAVISTFLANLMTIGVLFGGVTFDVLIHATVGWQGLGFVDKAINGIVTDLRGEVWFQAMTIVALAAALWFIINAVRGDTKKVTAAAAWSAFAVLLVATSVSYPAKAASVFDTAIGSATVTAYGGGNASGTEGAAQSADDVVSHVFDIAVYQRWCEGMVGADQKAIDKWCPRLWKASFLSATEARTTGPARTALVKQKQRELDTVAAEIKEQDPPAYDVLQGRDPSTRIVSAGLANLVLAANAFFPIFAALVMLVGLLLLRVAVLLAPIVGPILVHPAAQRTGKSVLRLIGGSAVHAVTFAFASAVFLRIAVTITAADGTPLLLRLLVLGVLSVAMWVITRPFRRLFGLGRGVAAAVGRPGSSAGREPAASSVPAGSSVKTEERTVSLANQTVAEATAITINAPVGADRVSAERAADRATRAAADIPAEGTAQAERAVATTSEEPASVFARSTREGEDTGGPKGADRVAERQDRLYSARRRRYPVRTDTVPARAATDLATNQDTVYRPGNRGGAG